MNKCTCGKITTSTEYIKMGKDFKGNTRIWKYIGCKYCSQPLTTPQMTVVVKAIKE